MRNKDKRKKIISLLCLLLFSALLLTGCVSFGFLGGNGTVKPVTVNVVLAKARGVRVVGDNPIAVKLGESAVFTVQIEDGVEVDSLSHGELTYVETIKVWETPAEEEEETTEEETTADPNEQGGDVPNEDVAMHGVASLSAVDNAENKEGDEAPEGGIPTIGATEAPQVEVTLHVYTLTLNAVWFPTTVKMDTHRKHLCEVQFASANEEFGTIESTLENGTYWSETEVTLTATPKKGYLFVGFSLNAHTAYGGEIISSENPYTFTLDTKGTYYANFIEEWIDPAATVTVPKDKWVLIYHTNGGVLNESGDEGMKTVQFSSKYYHCPNTLANRDYFSREGYVLIGYNTEKDGTGTYYAPGWNVIMPERGAISLYCMWMKEASPDDFEYTTDVTGRATITRYKGDDETVVIPLAFGKRKVGTIKENAFANNKKVKTVVIHQNVTTIENNAFANCTALSTLYLSDTVSSMKDEAFSGCTALSTVNLMAVYSPNYPSGRNGTYAIKFEWLMTAPGNKIVITSGSNSAYGINSPEMEKQLKAAGYDYSVVNYGTNASTPANFYIEVVSNFIKEGDILIHEGEYNNYQWGYNEINNTLWQIFEGAFDAFSLVDIRHYTKFFTSFAAFNAGRNQKTTFTYETYTSDTVNSYGDYSKNKTGYTSDYKKSVDECIANGSKGSTTIKSTINAINNAAYLAEINRVFDLVTANGGDVLISFPAINKICLNLDSQTENGTLQKQLEQLVDTKINGTRISRVATYIMDTQYFYNSHYHLGSEGAIVRTTNLVKDLVNYLKKK